DCREIAVLLETVLEVDPLLVPAGDARPQREFLEGADLAPVSNDRRPHDRIPTAFHPLTQDPDPQQQFDPCEPGEADKAPVVEMEIELHVRRPDAKAQQRLVEYPAAPAKEILEDDADEPKEQHHQFKSKSSTSASSPLRVTAFSSLMAAPSPAASF